MTLIAGFKFENQGIVISDFRNTNERTNQQHDQALKCIDFDNRLMLYMSGYPALLLPQIQSELPSVSHILTYENVDQPGGPLSDVIVSVLHQNPEGAGSSIIGVYLDKPSYANKMFRIKCDYSNGNPNLHYVQDSEFEWEVIGTGSILKEQDFFPAWKPDYLFHTFRCGLARQEHIETVADVLEIDIKNKLQSLGHSVYRKLGISPVMNKTIIDGSAIKDAWRGCGNNHL